MNDTNAPTVEQSVENEVAEILDLEKSLADLEAELSRNEQFRKFLQTQKQAQERIKEQWQEIERQMIALNVKSLKGDWGSITIAERVDFDISLDELAPRYFKRVPDTTKIRTIYRLTNEPPKGATPKFTKFLTKRIKDVKRIEVQDGE